MAVEEGFEIVNDDSSTPTDTSYAVVKQSGGLPKFFKFSNIWSWILAKIKAATLSSLDTSKTEPVNSTAVNSALSNYTKIKIGKFTLTDTTDFAVNVGFKPSKVIVKTSLFGTSSIRYEQIEEDYSLSEYKIITSGNPTITTNNLYFAKFINITSNGFTINKLTGSQVGKVHYYEVYE